jgi:hypothetical protein
MAQNQHYVPQFLLRNFGKGKKRNRKIWVFDKNEESVFRTSVRNIASEKAFYDLTVTGDEGEKVAVDFERTFSKMEKEADKAIKKLIHLETISRLSPQDLYWIAVFVATQFMRTKQFRNTFKKLTEDLAEKIKNKGYDPDKVKGFSVFDDSLAKEHSLIFFVQNIRNIVDLIMNKNILLFKTADSDSLYISDNPVTLHNEDNMKPYGNLGLGVKGIQIYLPLSRNLTIGFWCPSIRDKFEEGLADANKLREEFSRHRDFDPFVNRQACEEGIAKAEKVISKINDHFLSAVGGTPIVCDSENVKMLNSLQVNFSSRFVFSRYDNFDLIRQMINNDSKSKQGPMFELS